MAKVSFTSLKLKVKDDIKTFSIEDKEIEVKQYLPIDEKFSIIMTSLQDSYQNGIFNELILEVCFNLNIIFYYTNINFTEKQKEDSLKLYDILESNGVVEQIIAAIPNEEYNELYDNLEEMIDLYNAYRNSAKALVEQVSMFAPNTAAGIGELLQDFDVNKAQEFLSLAQYTGVNNK